MPDSTLIPFNKDLFTIVGQPVDCSNSLADASFQNPTPIKYDSTASTLTISSGYQDIFTHTLKSFCTLGNCALKLAGCISPFASTDIQIETSAPFKITAS